jgi:hypothetical protein
MSESIEPLLRDMLAWIGRDGRPYADVMDAWRTSCPRLQVWEEATDRGFVERVREGAAPFVRATAEGRAFVERRGPGPA